MARPHHHAYLWLGHGDILVRPGDAHRRPAHPEFRSAQVMPLECADWLLKPASRIEATFHEPEEGADWYAEQIALHAGLFAGSYAPVPAPEETVRALSAGADRVGGWWVTGGRFLSVSLIACSPHRARPDYACPLR
ncbi:hypothetical protein EYS09_26485 [Streptomyces kasugaensis]|uniref:Uncharacterized protein n=1 Tax=Streptomyces kasugaensis TaxID=1946 RepID=A0A4Q9HQI0_STRKA|nr:hypothetical protein [Streptomyces kasugaensis]TBO56719.1 hypothetical protein EYS09_26485 [Streptomyces kasugaensis]